MTTSYEITDGPKMLRETLCVAQARIGSDPHNRRRSEHIARLQRLINACDRHRPLGPDGKHGDRHTPTCGCEPTPETGGNSEQSARNSEPGGAVKHRPERRGSDSEGYGQCTGCGDLWPCAGYRGETWEDA